MDKIKDRRYYVVNDFGWGDKSIVESNLTREEALKLFNKEINGDFEDFNLAYQYEHPITEIREVGY